MNTEEVLNALNADRAETGLLRRGRWAPYWPAALEAKERHGESFATTFDRLARIYPDQFPADKRASFVVACHGRYRRWKEAATKEVQL